MLWSAEATTSLPRTVSITFNERPGDCVFDAFRTALQLSRHYETLGRYLEYPLYETVGDKLVLTECFPTEPLQGCGRLKVSAPT